MHRIDRDLLNDIDLIFSNQQKTDDLIKYVRENEPDFYAFIQERTGSFTHDFAKKLNLSYTDSNYFANILMCSFLFGYILYECDLERRISNLNMGNKFDMWMNGKLSSKYYKYSMDKLTSTSTLYTAKKNFLDRIKKQNLMSSK